jgi:hypothetical protein
VTALPLPPRGHEATKHRENSIPAPIAIDIAEPLDRLIEPYDATSKPHEVKKWQAEWGKRPEAKPAEKK